MRLEKEKLQLQLEVLKVKERMYAKFEEEAKEREEKQVKHIRTSFRLPRNYAGNRKGATNRATPSRAQVIQLILIHTKK